MRQEKHRAQGESPRTDNPQRRCHGTHSSFTAGRCGAQRVVFSKICVYVAKEGGALYLNVEQTSLYATYCVVFKSSELIVLKLRLTATYSSYGNRRLTGCRQPIRGNSHCIRVSSFWMQNMTVICIFIWFLEKKICQNLSRFKNNICRANIKIPGMWRPAGGRGSSLVLHIETVHHTSHICTANAGHKIS